MQLGIANGDGRLAEAECHCELEAGAPFLEVAGRQILIRVAELAVALRVKQAVAEAAVTIGADDIQPRQQEVACCQELHLTLLDAPALAAELAASGQRL